MRTEDELEPLAVSYRTARRLLDIGGTKLHELLNDGVLTPTRVGARPSVVYASIKKAVADGAIHRRKRSRMAETANAGAA